MEIPVFARLGLVYAHLLLCVFALHTVLSLDWRLLHSRISARELERRHRTVIWLLAGLWLSGLLVTGIDLDFNPGLLLNKPKLIAKLGCVTMLTLNGVLMHAWCMPRLAGRSPLRRGEAVALLLAGGFSTVSWLMAAFFGIARPLATWPVAGLLGLWAAALLVAVPVALILADRLYRRRQGREQAPALALVEASGTDAMRAAA
ncbi:MAG: hypothetical protein KGN16_24135 [Burkholderiales bacterium]|nr:hypothetical protein [Burkholderiales bacterium]